MTSPDLPAGRTIPDTDDLRLLAELINNEYIPLANAAWNAQMSQLEAATRLVEMAERGLPLRLVADGDRQQLWQIAQAGPATGSVGVPAAGSGAVGVAAVGSGVAEPSAPAPAPEVADAAPLAGGVAPAPAPTDTGSDGFGAPIVPAPAPFSAEPPPAAAPSAPLAPAVPPAPGPGYPQADAPGYLPAGSQTPYGTTVPPPVSDPIGSPVPPPAPVPPHEQAIAGAVPFGQPPFGQAPSAQSPLAEPPLAEPPLAEPPSAEPTGAQAPAFEPAAAAAVEDTETAGQVAEAPAEDGPAAPADDAPSAAFAAPLSDPDATQVASSADFDRARAAGFAAAAGVAADETAVYRPGTADDEAEGETGVGSEGGRHASTDADVSGQGQPAPDDAAPAPAEPPPAPGVGATADPRSTWGVPGTASWARADTAEGSAEVAAASTLAADQPGQTAEQPQPSSGPVPAYLAPAAGLAAAAAYQPPAPEPPAPPYEEAPAAAYEPPAPAYAAPAPAYEAPAPRSWATEYVAGPGGEQLAVTILDVLDPGDAVLTGAGYRMEPGQRAVLVNSSVANNGQVPYYPVGDLYLVLETPTRQLLGRAAIAVGSHPAYPVGVMPGQTARGWSVFLIPTDTVLAGIKWCIRPDLPQTILGWPIGGQ